MDRERRRARRAAEDGREQMEQLALDAILALEESGLAESMGDVNRRVLGLPPRRLVEWTDDEEGRREYRYRPMVELVLIEVASLASNAEIAPDERQRRIAWTLDIAGF
jgi:hypothetical protein